MLTSPSSVTCIGINLKKAHDAANELIAYIPQLKADILFVQEPAYFKSADKLHSVFNIGHGYHTIAAARQADPIRACIYISSNIDYLKLDQHCNKDIAVAIISLQSGLQILCISIYFDINLSTEFYSSQIDNIISQQQQNLVLIHADSNAHSALWGCEVANRRGYTLEDWLIEKDLSVCNVGGEPTFVSKSVTVRNEQGERVPARSVIDITLSSSSLFDLISGWRVLDLITSSDHRFIEFKVECHRTTVDHEQIRRFNTHDADWQQFASVLQQCMQRQGLSTHLRTDSDQIEHLASSLQRAIRSACDSCLKPARPNRFVNKWYNERCAQRKSEMYKSRRSMRRLQGRSARLDSILAADFLNAKDRYTQLLADRKKEYRLNFLQKASPDEACRLLRQMQRPPFCNSSIQMDSGDFTSSIDDTVQYALTRLFGNNIAADPEYKERPIANPEHEISEDEIRLAFTGQSDRKAPGYDLISGGMLKHAFFALSEHFRCLVRSMFSVGYFPNCLKVGVVRLIPKPGSTVRTIKAFRPITLLPLIGKAVEKILIDHINLYLFSNGLMSNSQYGFVRQRSTVDAIFDVVKLIREINPCRTAACVMAVSLDITGAFDNLKWSDVTDALRRTDVNQSLISLSQSYFKNREVRLAIAGCQKSRYLHKGCAQGSKCGPGFWNLVLNELLLILDSLDERIRCFAYADDILLVTWGDGEKCAKRLNDCLDKVFRWGQEKSLDFNPDKSQMIVFGSTYRPTVHMNGKPIAIKNTLKYLGVIFDDHLSWSDHIAHLISSAKQFSIMAGRLLGNRFGLTPEVRSKIYKLVVEARLTYASPAWATGLRKVSLNKIIGAQKLFARRIVSGWTGMSGLKAVALANIDPIEIVLQHKAAVYRLRRFGSFEDLKFTLRGRKWFEMDQPTSKQRERELCALKSNLSRRFKERSRSSVMDSSDFGHLSALIPQAKVLQCPELLHLVDYYTTQHISCIGLFGKHLHRIGKAEDDRCKWCGEHNDDAGHRIFTCPGLQTERQSLLHSIGVWSSDDLQKIISNSDSIRKFKLFCKISITGAQLPPL